MRFSKLLHIVLAFLLLLPISVFFAKPVNAATPTYGYTYTIGGTGDDAGYSDAIDIDSYGNEYIGGTFSGTNVNFNTTGQGSPDLHSANGAYDIFLTKINANGTYGYTYTIGGTSYDGVYSLTTDQSGNLYAAGYFRGTNINFNTTGQGSPDLHSSSGYNSFITKIYANGTYGYTYTLADQDGSSVVGVTTDPSGNVYMSGYFLGTNVDFNTTGQGSPDLHSSNGGYDIFITKINANGGYAYSYTIGGTSDDFGYSIATDSSGNIYFTGPFQGANVNFNTTGSGNTDLKTSSGGNDIYITKINANATYGYTYTIGGVDWDRGNTIDADSSGNVYLGGTFNGTNINFNTTGSGSPDLHTNIGKQDGFVTKFNSDSTYGWTYTIGGGNPASNWTEVYGVAADTLGNLYYEGYFEDSTGNGINFNPLGGTDIHHSAGGDDFYTTKLSGVFTPITPTPTPTTTSTGSSQSTNHNEAKTAAVCADIRPDSPPFLYQAETTYTTATLHINPAGGVYTKYFLAYGTDREGTEMYGTEFNQEHSTGALTYTINSLAPNTLYYFKTRAGNGCMPGDWSNNFKIKTTNSKASKKSYTTFTQWPMNGVQSFIQPVDTKKLVTPTNTTSRSISPSPVKQQKATPTKHCLIFNLFCS